MKNGRFKALVVRERGEGGFAQAIEERTVAELPDHDVLVRVHFSSLNYKDALSATGNKGVTRQYPHTPGIDASGLVLECRSGRFAKGQEVLVTGYDLGMNTPGGFGQCIRVPAEWVVARPDSLSLLDCMRYGTAGFTAAQALLRMEACGMEPGKGPVLVTGASGGVGSMAVALLAQRGYQVTAATGSREQEGFLRGLGAWDVVDRAAVDDASDKPMLRAQWAGVVDTVGGNILSTAIRSTLHRAPVACCGLVASPHFNISVYPLILRGVQICGIDSAQCPMNSRLDIWRRLSGEWRLKNLGIFDGETDLPGLMGQLQLMLQGRLKGRMVLKHEVE